MALSTKNSFFSKNLPLPPPCAGTKGNDYSDPHRIYGTYVLYICTKGIVRASAKGKHKNPEVALVLDTGGLCVDNME